MTAMPEWVTVAVEAFAVGWGLLVAGWNATLAPMVAAAPPQLGWALAGVLLIAIIIKK